MPAVPSRRCSILAAAVCGLSGVNQASPSSSVSDACWPETRRAETRRLLTADHHDHHHWPSPCGLNQCRCGVAIAAMIDVPNHFIGHCWIIADGSSWQQTERKGWGVSIVTSNTEGVHVPGDPALLAYRPRETLDAAIVEAYALAWGLRLQRCLGDKGPMHR